MEGLFGQTRTPNPHPKPSNFSTPKVKFSVSQQNVFFSVPRNDDEGCFMLDVNDNTHQCAVYKTDRRKCHLPCHVSLSKRVLFGGPMVGGRDGSKSFLASPSQVSSQFIQVQVKSQVIQSTAS